VVAILSTHDSRSTAWPHEGSTAAFKLRKALETEKKGRTLPG
jgi:hypothetical protein